MITYVILVPAAVMSFWHYYPDSSLAELAGVSFVSSVMLAAFIGYVRNLKED